MPDWYGPNNGRSVISPLFDGRQLGHMSVNYGLYDNALTNAAIDRALASATIEESEENWAQAVHQVTEDVAIVPLIERKKAGMQSSRMRNCIWATIGDSCDLASLWIAGAHAHAPVTGVSQ